MLVDASNCYDQIAHAMVSLIFQSFVVKSIAVLAMHVTIQEMKFYPMRAYGDLKTFTGSIIKIKMQGLGATGAILRAHGAKRHRAHFLVPLSQIQ